MMVTIFVDASFCGQTCAGGWGAWYKRDDMKRGATVGGELHLRPKSSNDAELYAIAHVLDLCDRRGVFGGLDAMMIQSDSRDALRRVLRFVPKAVDHPHAGHGSTLGDVVGVKIGGEDTELALGVVQDIARKVHRIYLRHVPGHVNGGGRFWCNGACDNIAKGHMRRQRAALKEDRQHDVP